MRATHEGVLTIGPAKMRCFVLDVGARLFSVQGVLGALGLTTEQLALLLPDDFRPLVLDPIEFLTLSGETDLGYEALFVKDIIAALLRAIVGGAIPPGPLAERLVELATGFALAGASVGLPRN